jgi:hypothetical protein
LWSLFFLLRSFSARCATYCIFSAFLAVALQIILPDQACCPSCSLAHCVSDPQSDLIVVLFFLSRSSLPAFLRYCSSSNLDCPEWKAISSRKSYTATVRLSVTSALLSYESTLLVPWMPSSDGTMP